MAPIPEAKNCGTLSLDESVVALIPDFGQIISIKHVFSSLWAETSKISILTLSSEQRDYFLKVSIGLSGLAALRGEYESSLLIHTISSDFTPMPFGYGSLSCSSTSPSPPISNLSQVQNGEQKHFFLTTFHSFLPSTYIPPPSPFCKRLALFHKNSTSLAPPKFGFHIQTYNGNICLNNTWCETWEEYFSTAILDVFAMHIAQHGERKEDERKVKLRYEMVDLMEDLLEKVIPRLLRPMEIEGREVRKSFVHGDLWEGNVGVDGESGKVMIFDAGGFWGHNEYELGNWRHKRNPLHKETYFEEYHKYFPKSEPVEDYEDRNALYAIKFNLHGATMFPDDEKKGFLDLVVDEMRRLVEKYPQGFEDEDRLRKE